MVIDPSAILTIEDMEKERTPGELSLWWEKKNREFASSKEGHHYALLKKGLTKEFYDEINPLKLLTNILYAGRCDIICIPNIGNDNFDAIIRNNSCSPPIEQKIEFTLAIDGKDDHLRTKYLVEHGHVSLTGPVKCRGTEKTDHKISVENEGAFLIELLQKNFDLIKQSAGKKCKPKNYGKNYILVIVIDDNLAPRYELEKDLKELNEFIKNNVLNLSLDFRELYILGYSGKTFLSYKIT